MRNGKMNDTAFNLSLILIGVMMGILICIFITL